MKNNTPRKPNKQEIMQIVEWLNERCNLNGLEDNIKNNPGLVNRSYISVFDNIETNGPDYNGKYMIVVWPNRLVTEFMFEGEKIRHSCDLINSF